MTKTVRHLASLTTLLAIFGCSKPSPDAAKGDAPLAASVSASATATPAPAPKATTSAPRAEPGSAPSVVEKSAWVGQYTSAKGALYVPVGTDVPNAKDWAGVKWRGDEAPNGLGDGALKLEVDTVGVVTGSVEGPLGGGVVSGVFDGKQLRASVRPNSGSTESPFYGTLLGSAQGSTIEGLMKLSSPTANVLRTATFKVTRS